MKKHLVHFICCLIMALTVWGCAHDQKNAGDKSVQMPLVIDLAPDGSLTVAKQPCPPAQLASRLAQLPDSRVRPVLIQAHERATYRQVAEVMEACKTAGFQQVSLKSIK